VREAGRDDWDIRRQWSDDAIRFLSGGPELDFWIEVLGADERQVRGLIAKALNGNGNGRRPAQKAQIIVDLCIDTAIH
jgi:hypothetical protein